VAFFAAWFESSGAVAVSPMQKMIPQDMISNAIIKAKHPQIANPIHKSVYIICLLFELHILSTKLCTAYSAISATPIENDTVPIAKLAN